MTRILVKGTSPSENKEIAVFEFINKTTVKCYSKKDKYFTITAEQKSEYAKLPRSSPYIFIRKNEKDPEFKYLSIRKQCKQINKEAVKLIKLTDGKINLFRTGSVAKTSLQLWYDLCNPPNADEIQQEEMEILEKCNHLRYIQPFLVYQ